MVDGEHDLIERLRAGDEQAFDAFVQRHDDALRRVARAYVRTQAAADDVVQETWLAMLRGLKDFEERSSLRTWLFRILVNRARTRATREARSLPFSTLAPEDESVFEPGFGTDGRWVSAPPRLDADPESRLLSSELREHLIDAVDGLAPAQRAVITLRDIVGLDAADVCDMLEVTDGNQRVLLHRARAQVRAALVPLVEVEQ
jgi:RNA polymerase sigma-70 factor (ECF subfamily)